MTWKTLDDMALTGKRVLTRVDINVPMEDGQVTDATRIKRILPTIRDIQHLGGIPVLMAHFGRPKGQIVPELSLQQLLPALEDYVGQEIIFENGDDHAAAVNQSIALKTGDIMLLENMRFYAGETTNDPEFSGRIAEFGDIFCNDAFSAAHRAHASTCGVAKMLPSCAGRLMQAELEALEKSLAHPEHPVVAVVGGAKVSTKLDLLGNLIPKVDQIIIGGGMANTFLAAQGYNVGKSLCEHDLAETARGITASAKAGNCALILPSDIVTATEFKAGAKTSLHPADDCPADAMILDAGPQSIAAIRTCFDHAKTLVWNGPLGAFEIPPFNAATDAAALYAAELSAKGQLLSVAGGGDTVAALNASGAAEKFTYISTAGGAFLEWMEGKTLPGVAALENSNNKGMS